MPYCSDKPIGQRVGDARIRKKAMKLAKQRETFFNRILIVDQHTTVSQANTRPRAENTAMWRKPGNGVSAKPM